MLLVRSPGNKALYGGPDWYPYRQEDSVSLHQKPLDAVQVQNGNSAYDTIQTLTGMPPDKVPLFRMALKM